ncbi:MAG TPA: hypothetical protein DCR43_01635 [Bacteroidales bacterium]|nr:MAG: hypothetical protein A2X11_10615 [Bacteroidetes bacterium GWE2_42_24]OFY28131.1 MAG: hypothetical protein A2X09_00870 [Bacteroidetes bacterium GWF2_43_11]HAQ64551.1 hypothetical protein [Bacteroidales bacterium]HBZ65512.1 hypothetical protein [Bacteroidales bacterium]
MPSGNVNADSRSLPKAIWISTTTSATSILKSRREQRSKEGTFFGTFFSPTGKRKYSKMIDCNRTGAGYKSFGRFDGDLDVYLEPKPKQTPTPQTNDCQFVSRTTSGTDQEA